MAQHFTCVFQNRGARKGDEIWSDENGCPYSHQGRVCYGHKNCPDNHAGVLVQISDYDHGYHMYRGKKSACVCQVCVKKDSPEFQAVMEGREKHLKEEKKQSEEQKKRLQTEEAREPRPGLVDNGEPPAGWAVDTDLSGKTYYYNEETNSVSWSRPSGGEATHGGVPPTTGATSHRWGETCKTDAECGGPVPDPDGSLLAPGIKGGKLKCTSTSMMSSKRCYLLLEQPENLDSGMLKQGAQCKTMYECRFQVSSKYTVNKEGPPKYKCMDCDGGKCAQYTEGAFGVCGAMGSMRRWAENL